MPESLKRHFMLDPEVVYLNHGSFGACPRPVFEAYQRWQLELERQPVDFLIRRVTPLMAEARAKLAAYLGAAADEIVYFPNPTTAINMVARNMDLQPGDEILTTDHEYGAMDRTWKFVCRQVGARYVQRSIPLPVRAQEEVADLIWAGVTERTRAVFISHITSPTALTLPVREICRRAREAGILSIVDGAHAPGQISLNLAEVGADIYTGACHKWLCSPKGSAFLYARREVQAWLHPLVVSWGWESDMPSGSQFVDYHEWQGTRDLSAFLATAAAIDFQQAHDWAAVRAECRALVGETRGRLNDLLGAEPLSPDTPEWFSQMASVRLPPVDVKALQARLIEKHRVEVPVFEWRAQPFLRVSIQGYNTRADAAALLSALRSELG